ncbi:chemotaxis protein CheA [Oceanirhabdus sp. W0125-5]|uniref:chemotaxis protein CheA n=1 Tax=Oceanirhabdus sp. W0125-5 TaxID=2999116 RepID=UPI0022F3352B|nr:chemotaxis protein CheA [Oceanirhabdus sp. W0125-5]WBW95480.1 chemotaxis protein CheA [Oceanirhabdus sp. W0125-5]
MDTSQYLSMFLEESIENLQILNDSILELEQNPDDIDKVNEIFRVAHTLKGMSATMGYVKISELTHKMEDVLTKFREGELKVTQKMVTVLFKCLDTLEIMVNNISEGVEADTDIQELMDSLKEVATIQSESNTEKEVAVTLEKEDSNELVDYNDLLDLNEYDLSVMKQALTKEYSSYYLKITLDSNTLLKSARAFLVFKALEEYGEIIKSDPNAEEIENENFEFEIQLVYLSKSEPEMIEKTILAISEINNIEIKKINLEKNSIKHDIINKEIEIKEEKNVDETTRNNVQPVETTQKKKATEKKSKDDEKAVVKKKVHQSVRVDLERLDNFLTMVSELVIHRTRLEQISSNHKLNDLNETLEQIARTTSDLQDLVMKIRMLPLEVVFNRFPRMIRDLSVELDKDIEFSIDGADTELDRTVIDEIGDPLLHLLRNAADHGIESQQERVANGKSKKGHIKLSAYPEGTKAVIKVEDDGAGLDVEKIRMKAEEKGINTENMSESDIKNLIFAQGFSTSEEVTDVSGRGVGMDVVKTKIASLGGTVDVISELGKGTTFIIRLPLTLQIIQALLVKIGDETMAISLGYIDRVLDYEPNMIKRTNNKEVMVFNENVIPLIRVNEVLDIEHNKESKDYIVIVKVGEKSVGLLVNGLLGQQEIVIKPLGKTLQNLKEYIGATILGDGLVTLILDVAALI